MILWNPVESCGMPRDFAGLATQIKYKSNTNQIQIKQNPTVCPRLVPTPSESHFQNLASRIPPLIFGTPSLEPFFGIPQTEGLKNPEFDLFLFHGVLSNEH
jgi:hypothetical protein